MDERSDAIVNKLEVLDQRLASKVTVIILQIACTYIYDKYKVKVFFLVIGQSIF